MIRVTVASYDDEPPLGGQGVVLRGMRSALERRGVEVTTVSGRGANAVAYPSVLHRAPLDLSLHLNRHPELLVRAGPGCVHVFGGPGGVILLRRPGVPVVYTAHHTYRQAHGRGRPRRLLSPLEAAAYRRAAMVLPVSPSTAAAVLALGVHPSRVEVVPPGIDVPPLDDGARDPGRLLFVGRLEPEKGVGDAVAVMAALAARRPDVTGAVVGSGGSEEEVRAALAPHAPRLRLLGAVDNAALAREYARASVVLVPSRYEGLGLVALEAIARGAAVAGYDVDGLRDTVGESGGGRLVPPGDAAALLRAGEELLDPGRRREAVERGRASVAERHSWDAVGRRLTEIYADLTSRG